MRAQDFKEVVDDMINSIRKRNTNKAFKFDEYVERKEMEAKAFEDEYFEYKKEILSSGMSRELAFEKLEFMFDRLLEEKEDVQMLKNYRKVS
tara:strand:+ start:253 stop:528 length:276 start_codon:yes stop_codon:yes gene_type:complete